jgi:hypothetical protein
MPFAVVGQANPNGAARRIPPQAAVTRVLDEAQRIIADSRVGSDLKEVLEEIVRAYSADEV